MNENERCINCRFRRKLKEHVKGKWIIKSCCTIWAETEPDGGYDSFVLVIDDNPNNRCECFNPREEATKKLITGGIEDVIAELKGLTQKHSIICSPIVRKVLEDAIPKSFGNALIFDTPHLNGTDSIYVFDGDISDPKWYADKIPITTFGEETEA